MKSLYCEGVTNSNEMEEEYFMIHNDNQGKTIDMSLLSISNDSDAYRNQERVKTE
jgi:hypothetical protein